jgi:hypothetical protein
VQQYEQIVAKFTRQNLLINFTLHLVPLTIGVIPKLASNSRIQLFILFYYSFCRTFTFFFFFFPPPSLPAFISLTFFFPPPPLAFFPSHFCNFVFELIFAFKHFAYIACSYTVSTLSFLLLTSISYFNFITD